MAENDPAHVPEQTSSAEVEQPLIGDGHRIARLLEEENRILCVDLVRCADALLYEGKISTCEATDCSAWADGTTPRACAAWSAWHTWMRMGIARSGAMGPGAEAESGSPSRYSMIR